MMLLFYDIRRPSRTQNVLQLSLSTSALTPEFVRSLHTLVFLRVGPETLSRLSRAPVDNCRCMRIACVGVWVGRGVGS